MGTVAPLALADLSTSADMIEKQCPIKMSLVKHQRLNRHRLYSQLTTNFRMCELNQNFKLNFEERNGYSDKRRKSHLLHVFL